MCVCTGPEHNYLNEKDRADRTSSVQKCLGRAQCPSLSLSLILSCAHTHSHGHWHCVPLDIQVNSAEILDDKLTPPPSIKKDMTTQNKTFKPRLFTVWNNNKSNVLWCLILFQKFKVSNQYNLQVLCRLDQLRINVPPSLMYKGNIIVFFFIILHC